MTMFTGVEKEDEIQVIFYQIADHTGTLFKIDKNDIIVITWDQVEEDLPTPNIKIKD